MNSEYTRAKASLFLFFCVLTVFTFEMMKYFVEPPDQVGLKSMNRHNVCILKQISRFLLLELQNIVSFLCFNIYLETVERFTTLHR